MSEDFFIEVDDGPKKKRKLNGVQHHKENNTPKDTKKTQIEEEEDRETADDKRLRLAKEYLDRLASVEDEDKPDADLVAQRLDQDELKLRGKRFQEVASQLEGKQFEPATVIKGHQGVVTCIAVSPDFQYAVTGSKDGTIVKWELSTLKKLYTIHSRPKKQKRNQKKVDTASLLTSNSTSSIPLLPTLDNKNLNNKEQHTGGILSVAICFGGKFLATGGDDRTIILRDLETGHFIHRFEGHRGPVSGLCFVEGLSYIYSCSLDRTVKVWSTEAMTYIDTLFGHQSEALTMCILSSAKERCITAGRDQSVRIWKVAEEKQLLFNSGPGNIDSLVAITGDTFVTGSDSGSLCVYNTNKKKPTASAKTHTTGALPWVSAVGAISHTDLCASGGSDGFVRLWQVTSQGAALREIGQIEVAGSVNGIAFAGNKLVVAVGQEHRLGRWARVPKVKNGIAVIPLPLTLQD